MWWVNEDDRELLVAIGLRKVRDAWKENLSAEIINDRGERQVIKIRIPDRNRQLYLKRWQTQSRNPFRILTQRSIWSRARSEFRNLRFLRDRGFLVPTPICFGEERTWTGPTATILVLDELPGFVPADSLLSLPLAEPEAEKVLFELGKTLARLHEKRIFHRSPGLKHFYLKDAGPFDEVAILDLPRLEVRPSRWWNLLKSRWSQDAPSRERDLAKFLLSLKGIEGFERGMEASFWRGYLSRFEDDSRDMNRWIEQVREGLQRREISRKKEK